MIHSFVGVSVFAFSGREFPLNGRGVRMLVRVIVSMIVSVRVRRSLVVLVRRRLDEPRSRIRHCPEAKAGNAQFLKVANFGSPDAFASIKFAQIQLRKA